VSTPLRPDRGVAGSRAEAGEDGADDHRPPGIRALHFLGTALVQLFTRTRRLFGFGVMRASASLRDRSGEPIRARARLKIARIEETYRFSQEISLNAGSRMADEPKGLIKLVLPYDGGTHFTRQAHRDVTDARDGGAGSDGRAIVGFLALTSYEKTGLEPQLGLQANFGSVPILVDLPPAGHSAGIDRLLADDSACVVSEKYRPEPPPVFPVHIDMELDDPDTAGSRGAVQPGGAGVDGISDMAARRAARVEVIEKSPERQLDFEPELWLRLTVRLHLPRAQATRVKAEVSKVFISWPTHTSLRSLELRTRGRTQLRYNPQDWHAGSKGGLEWSSVPIALDKRSLGSDEASPLAGSDGGEEAQRDDEMVTLSSQEMVLAIANPGDLYKQEKLSGWVEVKANCLLSGMEGRLYDATGKERPPQSFELKLASKITTEFSLPLYDTFANRMMTPYQWLHFHEVIPSMMRIEDIVRALRNRGFKVKLAPDPDPENCMITADLMHGPDPLHLVLYVIGQRYLARRERRHPGGTRFVSEVDSGDLRILAYGSLRAESQPVVREINELRRALRERFDHLPAGR